MSSCCEAGLEGEDGRSSVAKTLQVSVQRSSSFTLTLSRKIRLSTLLLKVRNTRWSMLARQALKEGLPLLGQARVAGSRTQLDRHGIFPFRLRNYTGLGNGGIDLPDFHAKDGRETDLFPEYSRQHRKALIQWALPLEQAWQHYAPWLQPLEGALGDSLTLYRQPAT